MAKTYYQLGKLDDADMAMRQAVDNAGKPGFRTLYEAKLTVLTSER
jgi:hypothetical protein